MKRQEEHTFQEVSPILQVQVEAMCSQRFLPTLLTMTSQTLAIKETTISWPFKLLNDFKCYCPVL